MEEPAPRAAPPACPDSGGANLCRSSSRGPYDGPAHPHHHGGRARGGEPAPRRDASGRSGPTRREFLGRLGAAVLVAAAGGSPWRGLVRAVADDAPRPASGPASARLFDSERAALREQDEGLEADAKETTPPRVSLPTLTFDRRLVLHRGGREVHLLFLGRAHTAGDVVAFDPSERVVATGDLMHGLLPYMSDGFPDEWPATLRALEALDFDRVVPGHGSVQEGKSVLAEFRGDVEEVTEKVARGVERGQPLNELQKAIAPGTLTSLSAGGMRRRLERELGALFPQEKPAAAIDSNVRGNVGQVFVYLTERKGRREMPAP